MRQLRGKKELLQILRQQVQLLELSSANYDAGYEIEALRLAVHVRTLVHDTGDSVSLLKQLGIKDQMQFIDSAAPISPVPTENGTFILHGMPGLTGIAVNGRAGASHIPVLSMREGVRGPVSFKEWWTDPCVPDTNQNQYSRKQMTLWLANKEGGAHVDVQVNRQHDELAKSSQGSFKLRGKETPYLNSLVNASIRQIAWELLESLHTTDAKVAIS